MLQNLKRRFQFPAHFDLRDGRITRFVSTIEYESHDPTSLSIDLLLLGDKNERFLSASYKLATLESSYFLSYSAIESIVLAYKSNDRFLLKPAKWKKIEKSLRDYLDNIAVSDESIEKCIDKMKEKLPELRRSPGEYLIIDVCQKLGVKTQDLWLKEGFETGIKGVAKIRNDLFHSALCKNNQDLSDNLMRLQILTERILLKVLNWPDDKIWRWYDEKLDWVNKK